MGTTLAQLDSRTKWAAIEIDPAIVAEIRTCYPFLTE